MNKKGFTMPELLVTLLVIGVLSILITRLLTSSADHSVVYSEYGKQQFTVQQALIRLSKEIEEADNIVFDPGDKISAGHYQVIRLETDAGLRRWKLLNGELSLYNDATSTFDPVITGLDTTSAFLQNDTYHCLTVVLKPKATVSAKNRINMEEPIVAQFSYVYK